MEVQAVSPQRGAWAAWSCNRTGGSFAPRGAPADGDGELCCRYLLSLLCYFTLQQLS